MTPAAVDSLTRPVQLWPSFQLRSALTTTNINTRNIHPGGERTWDISYSYFVLKPTQLHACTRSSLLGPIVFSRTVLEKVPLLSSQLSLLDSLWRGKVGRSLLQKQGKTGEHGYVVLCVFSFHSVENNYKIVSHLIMQNIAPLGTDAQNEKWEIEREQIKRLKSRERKRKWRICR